MSCRHARSERHRLRLTERSLEEVRAMADRCLRAREAVNHERDRAYGARPPADPSQKWNGYDDMVKWEKETAYTGDNLYFDWVTSWLNPVPNVAAAQAPSDVAAANQVLGQKQGIRISMIFRIRIRARSRLYRSEILQIICKN